MTSQTYLLVKPVYPHQSHHKFINPSSKESKALRILWQMNVNQKDGIERIEMLK